MENEKFDFKGFFEESKMALLKPKEYFSSMKQEGGYGVPILKAVMYGLLAGVISLIWNIVGFTSVGLGGLAGGVIGLVSLFLYPVFAVVGLFVLALILLIISAICNGKNDFEPMVRVSAALMILMPVGVFLGFFGGLSLTLGSLIKLIVRLYGIWMIYHGVTLVLNAKVDTAKIVSYVLAGIAVMIFLIGFGTRRAAKNYMKGFSGLAESASEYQKAAEELSKEMSKDYEKAAKEMAAGMEEVSREIGELAGEMDYLLEDADRNEMKDITQVGLKRFLANLNEGNRYATFYKGNEAILKANWSEEGYQLEYNDEKGHFVSKAADLKISTVEKAFVKFFKGESDWKDLAKWEEIEE